MSPALLRAAGAIAVAQTSLWQAAFADGSVADCGLLAGAGSGSNDCKGVIRDGSFSFDDVPRIIQTATTVLMGITGTISMIMIIVGGFKYALGSVEGDKTKGKDALVMGVAGFVVSALAWFAVRLIVDNALPQ